MAKPTTNDALIREYIAHNTGGSRVYECTVNNVSYRHETLYSYAKAIGGFYSGTLLITDSTGCTQTTQRHIGDLSAHARHVGVPSIVVDDVLNTPEENVLAFSERAASSVVTWLRYTKTPSSAAILRYRLRRFDGLTELVANVRKYCSISGTWPDTTKHEALLRAFEVADWWSDSDTPTSLLTEGQRGMLLKYKAMKELER